MSVSLEAPSVRRRSKTIVGDPQRGKREENKQRKLGKIARAAKQVLSKKGFEAATMQEIARLAGVATGTLFLYADNKRDLAYLAMQQDFEAAQTEAAAVPTDRPLVEQFVGIYRPYFTLYNANPEMAKIILSEFLFYAGKQARRHGEGVAAMKAEATRRAGLAQARGHLASTATAGEVGELVYIAFQGVIRRWVQTGAIDAGEGLDWLRRTLDLALSGLSRPSD